jgi:hypothetical protein
MFRRLKLVAALFFCCTSYALGESINLGLISFDVLIPGSPNGGVNVFNISNFTGDPGSGGFALPPDFPVYTFLTFINGSLTLPGGPPVIPLGDIGPGSLIPPPNLQFPDTTSFSSAVFTATLGQLNLLLSDGSTFISVSSTFQVTLLPSSGPTLAAGTDFAVISVTGQISSPIPEPSTFLVGGVLAVLILRYRNRRIV